MPRECENIFAWVTDSGDSFCAVRMDDTWFPLVFGRLLNAQRARELAQDAAKASGKTTRLVRFTRADVIETIEP